MPDLECEQPSGRLVLLRRAEQPRTRGPGAEKCINELVAEAEGRVQGILLASTLLDVAVRAFLVWQMLRLENAFAEKWVYLVMQVLIRAVQSLCLCGVALRLFEDSVSAWLNQQRVFEGWCSLRLLLPAELFLLVPGPRRVAVFLVVNSIYRGIEVAILFAGMLFWAVQYMLQHSTHAQDMLLLTATLSEELIRYILLLAYLGCETD
jgi:hypothetical protein